MEELTIKLTDETVRRVNETLCDERYQAEREGYDYQNSHDDEKTYWAKN